MNQPPRKSKIKACYVLSYKSPDYIRTRVLLAALQKLPGVKLSTAINSSKSVWRYPQTLLSLIKIRFGQRPDVYILGFRGHEIYWPVRLLTYPKPIIFDEFLNMQDWLVRENKKVAENSFLAKTAYHYVRSILRSTTAVISDTQLGAKSSSRTYNIPLSKYHAVYVGADERLFYPRPANKNSNTELEVFFYGNMAPLHGLEYILEAASSLKDKPVHFTIVGGRGKPNEVKSIQNYIKANKLTNITYKDWLNFESLPDQMASSDIFLGGPFGNTSQSRRVITGKTFQALAMSKPTIIGTIKEAVGFVDKMNCLLVDQGSAEPIVKAIIWADNNRSKLIEIGREARELYIQKFSVSKVSITLEEILKTACE